MGLATSGQRDFGQRDKEAKSQSNWAQKSLQGLPTTRVAPTQTYSAGL